MVASALQDWPEPVVRVQSLAESGVTVLPDRYIKPVLERPYSLDSSMSHSAARDIPVIDLGGLWEGSVLERRATLRAISDACREWGFFQVVNHGVSIELMSRVRKTWKDFFHLPMEQKQNYSNSPATCEGYGSRVGLEKEASLDWGDYYFLHFLPKSIRNFDKWPSLPSSLRETIEEYSEEVVKLCGVLMKVLSLSLGLDVGELQQAFGGEVIGACMRVNYYPRCPQPELTMGLSSHSDPGGLTLLLADEHVTGLQVRKSGNWVTVQPVPNAFIVNIGDQIQVLSNAIYKSVEHRVVANASEERLSIALFYNPRSDLPLAPVPELVSPCHPPLYQPMTFEEYRTYIRRKGLHGKAQVESLKSI